QLLAGCIDPADVPLRRQPLDVRREQRIDGFAVARPRGFGEHVEELPRAGEIAGAHGSIPQTEVVDSPGSSTTIDSPLRNALGGQVIGSTARLRRSTLGCVSPVKSVR